MRGSQPAVECVCVHINAHIASFRIVYTCSSTPLNADERAGIVVRVLVKTLIEKDLDTSVDTSFEDDSDTLAVAVKDRDEAGTLDVKECEYVYALCSYFQLSISNIYTCIILLQGAPDLSVLVAKEPSVF